MATLDLTYLRKLMGDAWVDAEVCTQKPTHLLGRQQKHDQNSPWVRYTEELVKVFFTSESIRFVPEVLADKIKEQYDSTLAEIESTVFLAQQGFAVTLEPTAPKKGPDIRADWGGIPYFVEIRTVGFSEEEERFELISEQIFAKLDAVPSCYFAAITIADDYTPNSPQTNTAIASLIEVLEVLKEKKIIKATFYYAHPGGKVLNPGGDFYPTDFRDEKEKRWDEIVSKAEFVARLDRREEELKGTLASLMRKSKHPPQPVNTHERLKKILMKKRNQLSKAARGIISLDVSEQFMLSEFSVESALYGDLEVQFRPVSGPSQPVGELIARRNNRGFFRQTSRVSAIVIQKRMVEGEQVKCSRKVYPTNRANADTIRLNLAELRRFGELEDRAHLSAEHAPNHVDKDDDRENDIEG